MQSFFSAIQLLDTLMAFAAETALSRVTYNNLLLNFQVNAFGPVLVTKVCDIS